MNVPQMPYFYMNPQGFGGQQYPGMQQAAAGQGAFNPAFAARIMGMGSMGMGMAMGGMNPQQFHPSPQPQQQQYQQYTQQHQQQHQQYPPSTQGPKPE
jgi:hypothetical protein